MNKFLHSFAERFASLNATNLSQLHSLYHELIQFRDPLHEVKGLPALHHYFAELYSNVSDLSFEFVGSDQVRDGEGYLRWVMRYSHPRLDGAKTICVEGCSHLMWHDGKVYSHRDYFDAGALLYEHLPLIGRLIRWLKRRLA